MSVTIHQGDCLESLRKLPDASVNCCVTSPPYWGLRSYLPAGHPLKHLEIGQEKTPEEYVAKLVAVFAEVRRVLRDDGTLWLNLGDCYCSTDKWGGGKNGNSGKHTVANDGSVPSWAVRERKPPIPGVKPKDLIGVPWMVAFALRYNGWYLRQQMPWVKWNGMPESCTDRPSTMCETIFLLSKSEHYYYDHEAVKLPGSMALLKQIQEGYKGKATKDFNTAGVQNASAVKSRIIANRQDKQRGHSRRHDGFNARWDKMEKEEQCSGWRSTRNSDWFFESIGGMLLDDQGGPLAFVVSPAAYKEKHFATFPPDLIKPCVLAGCPAGGTILDPFSGSGTVGQVALEYGRHAVLCELNPDYIPLIEDRTNVQAGLPL